MDQPAAPADSDSDGATQFFAGYGIQIDGPEDAAESPAAAATDEPAESPDATPGEALISEPPTAAQPLLLPAPAFQVADIVITLRELVQQGGEAIRLPVGSAGIVLTAALDFVTVDFEGLGARMVPAHCLAVIEPTPRESPPDQVLDLVAALAAKVGAAH